MLQRSAVSLACTAARAGRPVLEAHRGSAAATAMRAMATVAPVSSATRPHKVVVIGGGTAGVCASHQLLQTGRFAQDDIAIVDPADFHHYQPGWTLVGGGLKTKEELKRPMRSLVDPKLKYYKDSVATLDPDSNSVTLGSGDRLAYEHLIVVPGIKIDYASIKGVPEALADPTAPVSSIYGYETCGKVFPAIQKLTKGTAIFTQPAGIIKCAGAPQKVMWLALDHWKRAGLYKPADPASSPINITFATGLPSMFGVPKYSAALEELRRQRGVEGLFKHDLVEVKGSTATFAVAGSSDKVTRRFDFLHVAPKMGPHEFVKKSPLGNEAGYVDVDEGTMRHKKYPNVWSIGDASNLPTSKTAAAITAESPVMVKNLMLAMDGKAPEMTYDGYTSCPLLTEYGKVMLAEFKYAGVPKETFSAFGDQSVPRRAFYHMKKSFFPWVYYKSMVKGTWGGPSGWLKSI